MSVKGDYQKGSGINFDQPDQGDVFEVLSNERRRYVLRVLRQQHEDRVDIGDLAEQIAAWENSVDPGEVTYDQRKRVYTALQQIHLPMMDDAGAIEFQKNRGYVEWVEETDDFDYYLTVVPNGAFLLSHYYAGLGILSMLLGISIATGTISVPIVPDIIVLAIIIVAFGGVSMVHVFERNRTKWEANPGERFE